MWVPLGNRVNDDVSIFCRSSCLGRIWVGLVGGFLSLLLLLAALARVVFVCVFLQCFSVFSPSCSCVGQALFGYIKIVFVNCFLLNEKRAKARSQKKLHIKCTKSLPIKLLRIPLN
jgi:hypothetical protein